MIAKIKELADFLWIQRIKGFNPPEAPSLDPQTLERLSRELAIADAYLEFGCGGSTLLADRLGVRTVSVESDPYYAAVVRSQLKGTTVQILSIDIGITGEWGWPLLKRPTQRRLKRWARYVRLPFDEIDPDLILVDGRFRVAACLEAARQTAGATLIFDDYASRPSYWQVERYLGPPERVGRSAVFKTDHHPIPDSTVETAIRDPF